MINVLKVERFKSVRQLHLNCRRVNIFIGEPNTGKSNILEALGLLSWCASSGRRLKEFVRFQLTQNLFYDSLTDEPIRIECQGEPRSTVTVTFQKENFIFSSDERRIAQLNYSGEQPVSSPLQSAGTIKFYRFKALEKFQSNEPGTLIAPDGHNLFSVVYGSRSMRDWVTELFRPYGLAVVFKPHERAFELQKNQDGVVTAYPYAMTSDTLQRMLFFHAAMESNKDSVLVFEEPEAHAFPYYTKHLGERIALDASNQYFVATHNPYLLWAVIEKAGKSDVAVFATRYRIFQTEATPLNEDQLGRLLEADPFLGLESVVGEK
jgi:AAA15 family ATPase/GTPase